MNRVHANAEENLGDCLCWGCERETNVRIVCPRGAFNDAGSSFAWTKDPRRGKRGTFRASP